MKRMSTKRKNLAFITLASVFGVAAIQSTEAAVVSVTPAQFAGFSLDIDGDGAAELRRFQPTSGVVAFDLIVDGMSVGSHVAFPSTTFAGFESASFTDLLSFEMSDLFAGIYTAPAVISRDFDNFTGNGFAQASAPIQAWWSYGTSGSGSQPVHLLGVVIDYRAYFSSGETAAIDVYYHNFGSFGPNQTSGPISLATTGIPEPSSVILIMSALSAGLCKRRRTPITR